MHSIRNTLSLQTTSRGDAAPAARYRTVRPGLASPALALMMLATASLAGAHLAEFERNTAAWTAFAPQWDAVAFDEHYPGIPGTGCLSPIGPVPIPLDGGWVTLELSGGSSAVLCPIRDGSSGPEVSDAVVDEGQTLSLVFDPPIHAFYTFYSSVAVGDVVTMRLASVDGRIAGYDMVGAVSATNVLGTGHGFVSSVPIERVELFSSEAGTSVIGAFVGLVEGEPGLGGAGACGAFACDFGYAYGTTLPSDRLVTFDPDPYGDDFGWEVAMSGALAVVGAPAHTGMNGSGVGAAYVFRRIDAGPPALWALVAKLTPAQPFAFSLFGASVAIDGDRIVVGAPRTPVGSVPRAGAAHVFERHAGGPEQWGETKKLLPLVAEEDSDFGAAVALEGEVVLIGQPAATFSFLKPKEGAVAVHERDLGGNGNWGRRALLVQDFSESRFGASVALRGGVAVVGAPRSPISSDDDPRWGVVHLFGRDEGGSDAWGRLRRFFNGFPDDLGAAVAIDGDVVALGAPGERGSGDVGGRVWVLEKHPGDPWTADPGRAQVIPAPDAAADDRFGSALALKGDTLVVGAPRIPLAAGSAYRLHRLARGSWVVVSRELPATAPAGVLYGMALDFEPGPGERLLVGSPLDDTVFTIGSLIFRSGFESGDLVEWSP